MFDRLARFVVDENAAVSVDFLALSALAAALALAALASLGDPARHVNERLDTVMAEPEAEPEEG